MTLQFHINMLDTTKTVMTEKKHLASAKRQGKEHAASRKTNLQMLYPNLQEAIRDCGKNWNKSKINEEHLRKLVDIYEAAKRTATVPATDYQHGVQYAVFVLAILNTNRKGIIEMLKVKDFRRARNVYQEAEGQQFVYDGGEYFGKVVELLPSSGPLKGGAPVSIFFNPHVLELMNMVWDLARWFFVGDMAPRVSLLLRTLLLFHIVPSFQLAGVPLDDPESPLLISVNGRPATVDKSMYKKFAQASGLPFASANTLRKEATTNLMSDPDMRKMESETLGHTERVRAEFYDQGSQERKVSRLKKP